MTTSALDEDAIMPSIDSLTPGPLSLWAEDLRSAPWTPRVEKYLFDCLAHDSITVQEGALNGLRGHYHQPGVRDRILLYIRATPHRICRRIAWDVLNPDEPFADRASQGILRSAEEDASAIRKMLREIQAKNQNKVMNLQARSLDSQWCVFEVYLALDYGWKLWTHPNQPRAVTSVVSHSFTQQFRIEQLDQLESDLNAEIVSATPCSCVECRIRGKK